ncbi:MAG: hypothetical protein WD061_03160 [Candidatus Saccharimonadales bacterium]
MKLTNNNKLLKTLTIPLLTVGVYLAFAQPVQALDGNDFDAGNIISNAVMTNKASMSEAEIQSWLENTMNSKCLKNYSSPEPLGDNEYGSNVKASRVIWKSAQLFNINPQVLLVTLQKEQGLVTRSDCPNWRYNTAMGFGCPDGAPCDEQWFGFSQQVYQAARHFRGFFDNASGWWIPFSTGNNHVGYHPNSSCGGSTVNIKNRATVALYSYTPYQPNQAALTYLNGAVPDGASGSECASYGNRNFWRDFTKWFGSTQGSPFFRIGNTAPVYILGDNNNYYHVPSMDVLEVYGYGKTIDKVMKMDEGYIDDLSPAGTLPRIARFEDKHIYLIDDGGRHRFTSADIFQDDFGYSFGDEAKLAQNLQYYFPSSPSVKTVIRERSGSAIYFIENGQKRHIIDGEAFNSGSPAYSSRSRMDLSKNYPSTLSNGPTVVAADKLIRRSNGTFAYWDGAKLQNINKDVIAAMNVSPDYRISSSRVSGLPMASPSSINNLAKSTTGELFIMDNGKKLLIDSSDLGDLGLSEDDFKAVTSNRFLNLVRTKKLSTAIRINGGSAIFKLENGKRHHFNDWEAVTENGFSSGNITNVNSRTAKLFPSSGAAVLSTGTLFRIGNDARVYLVNNLGESLDIPSRAIFEQYGLSMNRVISLTPSRAANYQSNGVLGHFVKNSSGQAWMVHAGKHKSSLTDDVAGPSKYNLDKSNLPVLKDDLINAYIVRTDLKPNIIRAKGDTKVYLVEEGKKRWVVSRSTFEGMGHSFSQVTEASIHFVNSLPTGANID